MKKNIGSGITRQNENRKPGRCNSQQGFALFTTLIIVIVVGIVAVSSMRSTEMTEILAGNSIQRSRAIQAAEGGLKEGENALDLATQGRIFSTASGSHGVFSRDSVDDKWWRNATFSGSQVLTVDAYPAVIKPPEYVVEEIGAYVSDGGSGIVSLDRGSADYGSLTSSGRGVVLYRLQSFGVGSTTNAKAVVESHYVKNQ